MNVMIIGGMGFGGLGLISILMNHPYLKIKQIIDLKDLGKKVGDIYPHLKDHCNFIIEGPDDLRLDNIDIVFFATPDRVGMQIIDDFYKRNIPVIDFSGDFRFRDIDSYTIYAKNKNMKEDHLSSSLLSDSVYGLPELKSDEIRNAKIIGNPGCFAVSIILGILPLMGKNIISEETIICDGKTGVSGAGKNPGENNYYPQRYENINTYREGRHQHIVEVENVLNSIAQSNLRILFIPQVVPMNRGILTTIYMDLINNYSTADFLDIYRDFYQNKPFVTITDKSPNTTDVRGSNMCELRPLVDERTRKLTVVSVIDNLLKGQSGNAVQNANILLKLDETTGLKNLPFFP